MINCRSMPVIRDTPGSGCNQWLVSLFADSVHGACVPCVVATWLDLQAHGCRAIPGHPVTCLLYPWQNQVRSVQRGCCGNECYCMCFRCTVVTFCCKSSHIREGITLYSLHMRSVEQVMSRPHCLARVPPPLLHTGGNISARAL